MIAIEDSGPGIAPDEPSRIFEPFFTTRSGGLGMGLAICRRVVEAHGGRIRGERHRHRRPLLLHLTDGGNGAERWVMRRNRLRRR